MNNTVKNNIMAQDLAAAIVGVAGGQQFDFKLRFMKGDHIFNIGTSPYPIIKIFRYDGIDRVICISIKLVHMGALNANVIFTLSPRNVGFISQHLSNALIGIHDELNASGGYDSRDLHHGDTKARFTLEIRRPNGRVRLVQRDILWNGLVDPELNLEGFMTFIMQFVRGIDEIEFV